MPVVGTSFVELSTYRDVQPRGLSVVGAGTVAGTYLIFVSGSAVAAPGAAATGVGAFFYDPADYNATFLRIKAMVANNATPTGVTLTFGLYPVATWNGVTTANPTIATLGAVVATAAIVTPGGNAGTPVTGAEVATPAAGFYAFGVVLSGTTAVGSAAYISARMQVRGG